jgi:hypothetical protein
LGDRVTAKKIFISFFVVRAHRERHLLQLAICCAVSRPSPHAQTGVITSGTRREKRRVFVLLGRLLEEVKIDYDNLFQKLRTANSGIAIRSHLKETNIRHHEQLFGVARNKPQKIISQWLRSGKH